MRSSQILLLLVVAAGQIPQEPVAQVPVAMASADITQVPGMSSLSRQARRLYVGNIPFGVTDVSVCNFLHVCAMSEGWLEVIKLENDPFLK